MNDQEITILTSLLVLTTLVVIVLFALVLSQRYKLNKLQTPKYGFLGKALTLVVFASVVTLGGGHLYLNNLSKTPDSVSVSDKNIMSLDIQVEVISKENGIFKFSATPYLYNIPWGIDSARNFNFNWYFRNTTEITKLEYGLNVNFPGGIIITLPKGTTSVTVSTESYNQEKQEFDIISTTKDVFVD